MYTNKYNLNYGADPEFFYSYTEQNPKGTGFKEDLPFVVPPAHLVRQNITSFIGGAPKHPHYFENEHGRIIGDGVAMEVNLKKPYSDPVEMFNVIQDLIGMTTVIEKSGYRTTLIPTINFDYGTFWKQNLLEEDEYMYWAMIFGCDPSIDAFNARAKCQILDVSHHPFRYAGGHFHVSGNTDIEKYSRPFVKLLALTVGNYSILTSDYNELEKMRAKYYGKAGNYREQTYPDGNKGVEYRTPSNAWLSYKPEQYMFIFELINDALDFLKEPKLGKKLLHKFSEPTKQAIENADKDLARDILNSIGV